MSHCHVFDAQHHIAFVFLLLREEVKGGINKEREENRTEQRRTEQKSAIKMLYISLLTIHNELRCDEGISEIKREKDGEELRERVVD